MVGVVSNGVEWCGVESESSCHDTGKHFYLGTTNLLNIVVE